MIFGHLVIPSPLAATAARLAASLLTARVISRPVARVLPGFSPKAQVAQEAMEAMAEAIPLVDVGVARGVTAVRSWFKTTAGAFRLPTTTPTASLRSVWAAVAGSEVTTVRARTGAGRAAREETAAGSALAVSAVLLQLEIIPAVFSQSARPAKAA